MRKQQNTMDEDQDDSDGATSSSGGTTTTYGPALNYKPNNKFTASVKLLEANLGDTSKIGRSKFCTQSTRWMDTGESRLLMT